MCSIAILNLKTKTYFYLSYAFTFIYNFQITLTYFNKILLKKILISFLLKSCICYKLKFEPAVCVLNKDTT